MPTESFYNSNVSDVQINKIFELKKAGRTTAQIANQAKLKKTVIAHILKYYKDKHAAHPSVKDTEFKSTDEKISTESVRLKKITLSDGLELVIDFNKADERRLIAIIDLMADNEN